LPKAWQSVRRLTAKPLIIFLGAADFTFLDGSNPFCLKNTDSILSKFCRHDDHFSERHVGMKAELSRCQFVDPSDSGS
jgi:hypothetical protein